MIKGAIMNIKLLLLAFFSSFFISFAEWKEINNGLTNWKVRKLEVLNNNIFAGTYPGGVFLSTNFGNSWEPRNNGLRESLDISSFTVLDNNIFIGTSIGIYLSTNMGASWKAVNNGLNQKMILSLENYNGHIYAGTVENGVYKSTDLGNNWSRIGNGLTANTIHSIITLKDNIFVGTNCFFSGIDPEPGGVFLSTDSGNNWRLVNEINSGTNITELKAMDNSIFAGIVRYGIIYSSDKGQSWEEKNNGLTNLTIRSFGVYKNIIFSGGHGGVYISTDSGNNWKEINYGIKWTNITSFKIIEDKIFASTFGGGVFVANVNDFITDIDNNIENYSSDIKIYPVPADQYININLKFIELQKIKLEIKNIFGNTYKIIRNYQLKDPFKHEIIIDINKLPSGIYFFSLKGKNIFHNKKFVVTR